MERKYVRFKVAGCVLVSFQPDHIHLGEVTDISLGGIGFRCSEDVSNVPDMGTLGIYASTDGLVFADVPFRLVWNLETVESDLPDRLITLRYGLEFESPTAEQLLPLRSIIQRYTTADPES